MDRNFHRTMERQARRTPSPPPLPVQALFSTALQHHQAGRPAEADRLYCQVLAADPRHADSLHLRGLIALQNGRPDLAVSLIRQAIGINPNEALYHANLGSALWQQAEADAAIAAYRHSIALKPDYIKAHLNLALVWLKIGQPRQADIALRGVLARQPDSAEAYDALGTARKQQGLLDEAISYYRRAIHFKPDFVEAWTNLGAALWQQGKLDQAVGCYRRALELNPRYVPVLFNLGVAMADLDRLDDASACYRQVLSLDPDHVDACNNLATVLKQQGRLEEAVALYRKAVQLSPDCVEARSNLGIVLLALGQMPEGWQEHEWRWQTPHMRAARRGFSQPQWSGESGEGRTLLIHAEQGFGDTLQFCRYAPLAAARGLNVILEVQPPLVRLLRQLPGVARVIAHGDALPPFDIHCPMLSLPLALGTTMETIPAATAYLEADAADVAAWRARLGALQCNGLRVGLAWAGKSRTHAHGLAAVDQRRSMDPGRLAPLLCLPDLAFFSLQKEGGETASALPLIDCMQQVQDFADTAALIANLDLVISVDSAVAHLAAALGKPVWLLDRFDPCWRWFTGRSDSPWYPMLRIYRQSDPGDWDGVIGRVAADLAALSEQRRSRPAG